MAFFEHLGNTWKSREILKKHPSQGKGKELFYVSAGLNGVDTRMDNREEAGSKMHVFHKKKVYKNMRLKWPKS